MSHAGKTEWPKSYIFLMCDLSFKEYLALTEIAAEKSQKPPEFQDMASRLLGIDPEDREKQVYVAADVQDGEHGWNAVPMVMGKVTKKNGKVVGNQVKLLTNVKGNRLTRKFRKDGDEWEDMGRESAPARKRWLPADVIDKWTNQGAEGGMGMGGPPGL